MDCGTEDLACDNKTQTNDDENYNLLLSANENFTNAEYNKCLEILEQLEARGDSSTQILKHNRAVVNFYKSGCTEHAKLLEEINTLLIEVNSTDNTDATTLSLKHYASPVARYNKSVIYFHRHMYATALENIESLVNRWETLEKQIALMAASLNLQLLLSTNQLNKAEAFLSYLQNELSYIKVNPATIAEENICSENTNRLDYADSPMQLLQVMTNVLNRKPVIIPEDGSAEYGALKAHQYYIMKDFQMAAKQLMKINNDSCENGKNTAELNTCIANNMGVIHLRVRHYAIAAKFFQNAITFDKQIVDKFKNASLQTLSSARSCEILYNLAICMLHLRRPKEAFQCFLVPLKFYHSNPRIWFRISEACIMEHEMQIQLDEKNAAIKSKKPYRSSTQSAAVPEPTLEFAALCLRNALTLTQYYKRSFYIENVEETEDKSKNWNNVHDNNFCNPSMPISRESMENMLAAIYAAYSFVSLRLGDYVTALEMAQELLKSERLSDAHKLLGHMYAGEALMLMNKPAEARPHLDPNFVSLLNAFDFETRDWQVKSLDAAQNIVRYNLAVAMVLQSDYESAKSIVGTLTHPIVAIRALTLKKYLEMK